MTVKCFDILTRCLTSIRGWGNKYESLEGGVNNGQSKSIRTRKKG